jgi:hypothetical protein
VAGSRGSAECVLEGYEDALELGGRPIVLAEHHHALRLMATYRLHDLARRLRDDLRQMRRQWLADAAATMAETVNKEWNKWRDERG